MSRKISNFPFLDKYLLYHCSDSEFENAITTGLVQGSKMDGWWIEAKDRRVPDHDPRSGAVLLFGHAHMQRLSKCDILDKCAF